MNLQRNVIRIIEDSSGIVRMPVGVDFASSNENYLVVKDLFIHFISLDHNDIIVVEDCVLRIRELALPMVVMVVSDDAFYEVSLLFS